MPNGLIRLVVIQFVIYVIVAVLAFFAWAMVLSGRGSLSHLEVIVGEYLSGHLVRWTTQFPMWGVLILASATSASDAVWLLHRSRREGAYLGLISISIGFMTNIMFAQNVLVHSLIGALISWALLAPLITAWKGLK